MKDKILQTVTPESVGISSDTILNFIETLEKRGVNMHSFIMLRHGKICAEGYYENYYEEKLQRMYSSSKTITSIAVGLMADEGKIHLDDKIADHFPEFMPENPHPYVLQTKIEDMLRMSVPFSWAYDSTGADHWVKGFLSSIPTHPPGTVFRYETSSITTLGSLVEKLSGKTLLEYLREKLAPMEISSHATALKCPEGYSWGGSGILVTLRDMAKFALLMLNKGKFNGQQLLSEEYASKASSRQIFNDVYSEGSRRNKGYGYQIWILDDGVFAFCGLYSQLAICCPKKDFILCITCDNSGSQIKDRLIYEELLEKIVPGIKDYLEENPEACAKLRDKCANLKLATEPGEKDSPTAHKINGAEYIFQESDMDISSVKFEFSGDEGCMKYTTSGGEKEIHFGFGKNVIYTFPETHYFGETILFPANKEPRVYSSAAWADENTLVIRTHLMDEYLGILNMTFSFKGDEVGVIMHKDAEFYFDEYQGYAGGKRRGTEK